MVNGVDISCVAFIDFVKDKSFYLAICSKTYGHFDWTKVCGSSDQYKDRDTAGSWELDEWWGR